MITDRERTSLTIIGCCRPNEVDETHGLSGTLSAKWMKHMGYPEH
jgi:hypothetical protein